MSNGKWAKANTKPLLARVVSLDLGGSKSPRPSDPPPPQERNPLHGSDIYIGGGFYYCSPPNWFYPAQPPPPPPPAVAPEHPLAVVNVFHPHHQQHLLPYTGVPLTQDASAARRSVSESSDSTSDNGSLLAYSPPACVSPPPGTYSCDSGGGSGSVSLSDDSTSGSGRASCCNNSSPGSDATSVTSEDSLGKSVYCLPRVIKPRKRRKKDRNKQQQQQQQQLLSSAVMTLPPVVVQNGFSAKEHVHSARKYLNKSSAHVSRTSE